MANITMSVDSEILRKARRAAVDRRTTVSAMVREFLESVAAREEERRRQAARRLHASFRHLGRDMGPRTWTRDELHER